MSDHKLRCGDTARQDGTSYDIEVAYADYESGRASWCGWPEGSIEIERLSLIKECTDEEHKAAVARWLDVSRSYLIDHRRVAIERLYRPRAYWMRVRKECQERVQEAAAQLASVEMNLLEAQASETEDA